MKTAASIVTTRRILLASIYLPPQLVIDVLAVNHAFSWEGAVIVAFIGLQSGLIGSFVVKSLSGIQEVSSTPDHIATGQSERYWFLLPIGCFSLGAMCLTLPWRQVALEGCWLFVALGSSVVIRRYWSTMGWN